MAGLQYLDSQREAHPELAEWYTELVDLYERKLWHQLTLKLDQFIALPVFQAGNVLIELSHFAVKVSRQFPERLEAISFLQAVIEKLQDTKELRAEPILYSDSTFTPN